jgi:hypothetical protein
VILYIPTQDDLDVARTGIMVQFNAMFDQATRDQLMALGIQKFIDQQVRIQASDEAYIRYYANCLHIKE